uniref:ABC transporter domain-containing protein n=1 Tax=Macrostomum lignano TaxID=282301 RepID=A0A1I8JP95_9PLAT
MLQSHLLGADVPSAGSAQLLGNLFMNIGLGVAGERLTRRLRTMYFAAVLRQDMSYFDNPDNSEHLACGWPCRCRPCSAFALAWALRCTTAGCCPHDRRLRAVHGRGRLHPYGIPDQIAEGTDKSSEMAGQTAAEAIENLPTVQSLCREPTFFKRYCDYLAGRTGSGWLAAVLSVNLRLLGGHGVLMYAAAFRFGAYLVGIDKMTPSNVFKTFSLIPDYAKARISAGYILQLVAKQPLIDKPVNEGRRPDSVRGEIALEAAGCRGAARAEPVVSCGQTVALVGVSGCGKSTVMALLQRFYDPSNGRVTLDGADLRDLNVSWLAPEHPVVSQEPVLFARSIEANIVYGLDSQQFVTHETVEAAAKQSNIHDFVSGLPSGYATEVGERAPSSAAVRKQRVALARALVNRPKILLLDEATSALDTESEAVVQAALEEARQGRTCILIAHRLSTVQNADRIVVIEQGQGTHAELMRLGGAYYALASGAKKPGAAAADAPLVLDANAVVVNDNKQCYAALLLIRLFTRERCVGLSRSSRRSAAARPAVRRRPAAGWPAQLRGAGVVGGGLLARASLASCMKAASTLTASLALHSKSILLPTSTNGKLSGSRGLAWMRNSSRHESRVLKEFGCVTSYTAGAGGDLGGRRDAGGSARGSSTGHNARHSPSMTRVGAAVEGDAQRLEPLLAGRVPQLQGDHRSGRKSNEQV